MVAAIAIVVYLPYNKALKTAHCVVSMNYWDKNN